MPVLMSVSVSATLFWSIAACRCINHRKHSLIGQLSGTNHAQESKHLAEMLGHVGGVIGQQNNHETCSPAHNPVACSCQLDICSTTRLSSRMTQRRGLIWGHSHCILDCIDLHHENTEACVRQVQKFGHFEASAEPVAGQHAVVHPLRVDVRGCASAPNRVCCESGSESDACCMQRCRLHGIQTDTLAEHC